MFITIVTKCYYTCDLYYICDQLLHLCLQQTPNSRKLLEQNGFPRFAAVTLRNITNKEISEIIIKLFPKYTKKVMKFGLEVLTGKALSVWLEFIDETGNKVFFVYKCRLSYALLYLADMFTNKLKTRFNSNF